jgi:pimeloyl-ACP methyl ester carboxylesterase
MRPISRPTFVLIPGAGGDAWCWSRLVPELEGRGYAAIAVDIREDDPALGLPEYAEITLAAVGARTDVVLVGQSMGAFTVPVVAQRVPPRQIVLTNPMIPLPGETPGDWWDHTGWEVARAAADAAAGRSGGGYDADTYFLHDLSPELLAEAYQQGARAPAETPFGQPCEFSSWPDVPIHVITGADDRFFPPSFQQRIAEERLGVTPDVIPGGHLMALVNPKDVADLLVSYLD